MLHEADPSEAIQRGISSLEYPQHMILSSSKTRSCRSKFMEKSHAMLTIRTEVVFCSHPLSVLVPFSVVLKPLPNLSRTLLGPIF
jgi:hypothetical protein